MPARNVVLTDSQAKFVEQMVASGSASARHEGVDPASRAGHDFGTVGRGS